MIKSLLILKFFEASPLKFFHFYLIIKMKIIKIWLKFNLKCLVKVNLIRSF